MKARVATQPITNRAKVALAGAATGLALLVFTSGSALAGGGAAGGAAPGGTGGAAQTQGHGQMHQMMNSMHGEGASQKMHGAMGPQAEKMMNQCASGMDNMDGMGNMQNMMDGGMQGGGMMDGGMQGGQEDQPQDTQ